MEGNSVTGERIKGLQVSPSSNWIGMVAHVTEDGQSPMRAAWAPVQNIDHVCVGVACDLTFLDDVHLSVGLNLKDRICAVAVRALGPDSLRRRIIIRRFHQLRLNSSTLFRKSETPSGVLPRFVVYFGPRTAAGFTDKSQRCVPGDNSRTCGDAAAVEPAPPASHYQTVWRPGTHTLPYDILLDDESFSSRLLRDGPVCRRTIPNLESKIRGCLSGRPNGMVGVLENCRAGP